MRIAKKLDELGVDAIEAGFAASSKGEFEAIKLISKENLKAEIFSFARGAKEDIDAVIESDAEGVFLVIPSSEIHIKNKLRKTQGQILEITEKYIQYAKDHGLKVNFGAEDATRSEISFLKKLVATSINAGAEIVTLCDTVGILTPERAYALFSNLVNEFPGIAFGVHCHDDFGMAIANSIAALRAGAKEVHATLNGLGERAGNAALEEIVVALKLLYNIDTSIKLNLLYETSMLVSKLTKVPIQPNKAIVGENAFAHESGIHTHAILNEPLTYEPISPELVGRRRKLVVGKHAGSHGIKAVLNEMGIYPNEEQLREIFIKIKTLGDEGKKITHTDLESIAGAVMNLPRYKLLKLEEIMIVYGNKVTPIASVKLSMKDKAVITIAIGVGPFDAAINAIQKAFPMMKSIRIDKYYVKPITNGRNTTFEVMICLSNGDKDVTTIGVNKDIVIASIEAIISGMNILMNNRESISLTKIQSDNENIGGIHYG